MRHLVEGRKLNRTASHRKAMLANMAVSLLDKERITTTIPKAKELRRVVERLITYGKKGNLHGIRIAERKIKNKTILKKLFNDIAPFYKNREGGYTRILKLGERAGDNAPMAIIELTGRVTPDIVKKGKKKSKTKKTISKSETSSADVSSDEKNKKSVKETDSEKSAE